MEALILLLDMTLMVYLCWRVWRAEPPGPDADGGLGLLDMKTAAPAARTAARKDTKPQA